MISMVPIWSWFTLYNPQGVDKGRVMGLLCTWPYVAKRVSRGVCFDLIANF